MAWQTNVKLVRLPQALADRVDRRLPTGNRFDDLTGKTFGVSQVIGFAGYRGKYATWLCRCKCGTQFLREGCWLKQPGKHGCGCRFHTKSPLPRDVFLIWKDIKKRCRKRSHIQYHLYGARGIKVCDRWLNSCDNFVADMGPRPSPNHLVARRDHSKDFTPDNCYWGTRSDRFHTKGRFITHKGRTLTLAEWGRELGISCEAMRYRADRCLKLGLPLSAAVALPVDKRKAQPRKR